MDNIKTPRTEFVGEAAGYAYGRDSTGIQKTCNPSRCELLHSPHRRQHPTRHCHERVARGVISAVTYVTSTWSCGVIAGSRLHLHHCDSFGAIWMDPIRQSQARARWGWSPILVFYEYESSLIPPGGQHHLAIPHFPGSRGNGASAWASASKRGQPLAPNSASQESSHFRTMKTPPLT